MKTRRRISFLLLAILLALVPAAAQQPPAKPSRDLAAEFRDNLQQGILKFWIDHAIDREHGGMIGWLDRQGKPILPGTKSLVQQARIVWTFSAAYRQFPEPIYKDVATHTLKFLREKMLDPRFGGFYWLVDRDGRIMDVKKHLYGESFAIYALAEYARAFNDPRARREALALFRLIDAKAHDDVNGGYREAFLMNWRPFLADATLGALGRKTMNAHIHLLESFTTLYLATKDAKVRARVEELLDLCLNKIVDTDQGYARLYFTDDWQPADSETSSYGHDIELNWLLTEAAEALGRGDDPKVKKVSLALVDHTLRDGFDRQHGGVWNEGPAQGPARDKRMIWWVQAEATVGLLNAYQLTGKEEYRQLFEQQARYTLDHFADRQYGEWYNTIGTDGRITGDKANEWKAPYHAARACLEVLRRLQEK
jgi:mannobiose 2-epimerase